MAVRSDQGHQEEKSYQSRRKEREEAVLLRQAETLQAEAFFAELVLDEVGRPRRFSHIVCREVGHERYRVNVLVEAGTSSEFLKEARIVFSTYLSTREGTICSASPPLRKLS